MMKGLALVALSAVLLSSAACTQQNTAAAPDPKLLLQKIPDADRAKYGSVRDMRNWQNPYLIVRSDGVGLLDPADNAEIVLKPDELLPKLASLPASAWPYGRVVAAQENAGRASEQDGVAIRRNKGIIGGMLEGAHVAVEWVPSS